MVHSSVATFVSTAQGNDSLKQRLQSADLAELLAIADERAAMIFSSRDADGSDARPRATRGARAIARVALIG